MGARALFIAFLMITWAGMFVAGWAYERYIVAPLNAEQARLRRKIAILQRQAQERNPGQSPTDRA